MSVWKWLVHPEFGAHRVPDNPGVVPFFEGRGWIATDVPGDLDIDSDEVADAVAAVQPQAEVKENPQDKGEAKSAAKSKKEAE